MYIGVSNIVTLECNFLGNDKPTTIVWTKDGVALGLPAYTITETTLYINEFGSSVVSTLNFTYNGASEHEEFVCSSSNNQGNTKGIYNIAVFSLSLIHI